MCAFALVTQHSKRMRSIINDTIFGENTKIKCVCFNFLYKDFLKYFSF